MTITLFNLNLIITTTAISNQFNNGLIPQFNSNTSLLTYNNSDDNIVVFNHGENGYPCIRTPAIIKTEKSLLAFAGTRCGNGDGCNPYNSKTVDHMDTVMKKSIDNGKTWSSIRSIYSATCQDRDHGTPVYDRVKDRVVLVFRGKDLLTWTMYSDNDGESWSEPFQINLDIYNKSRVSPGRGLQLSESNRYAPNRLVFVAQFGVKGKSLDIVYYSDDHGITWTRSKTIIPSGNEAQIVELANSTLLMNARVEVKSKQTSRLFATSDDGGATWSSFTYRYDIAATSCMGSTITTTTTTMMDDDDDDATTGKQVLLYSHPSSQGKEGSHHRMGGTVWISNDEAESWNPFYHATEKEVGFAYSCLTETFTSKTIGLLYETEDADSCTGPSCKIVFTTFELPS